MRIYFKGDVDMNGVIEFLTKKLEEKEEMLENMKPWYDREEILIAINGIQDAISSFLFENDEQTA